LPCTEESSGEIKHGQGHVLAGLVPSIWEEEKASELNRLRIDKLVLAPCSWPKAINLVSFVDVVIRIVLTMRFQRCNWDVVLVILARHFLIDSK
jgi:hypothetical protein